MAQENRKHSRTPLSARVKISHTSFGTIIATTRDISDGGMFVVKSDVEFPPIGSVMEVQAMDMPVEAPILNVQIMRLMDDGAGLMFCDEP